MNHHCEFDGLCNVIPEVRWWETAWIICCSWCHVERKKMKWLISGFESHLSHSHQWGWFSSVKITRSRAPGCVFQCLKKVVPQCWSGFLLLLQLHSVVMAQCAERQGTFHCRHLQCRANLPSRTWSYKNYLGSSPISAGYLEEMRAWTSRVHTVSIIIHRGLHCYECKHSQRC